MVAPDLVATQRAAGAILDAGVGTVVLHGSLARGEVSDASDIDLVAIYDDLDYEERWKRRCALTARARAAAGCDVDVYVTDVPEWAVRTTKVPCALEARRAGYAVELADVGAHVGIDRDKEIGSPADPAAELASRFTDVSGCVAHLITTNHRWSSPAVAEKSSTAPSAARNDATSTVPAWMRRADLSDCVHFELEALVSLDAADDLEQVARVGVAARAQHAHEALGLLVCQFAEF